MNNFKYFAFAILLAAMAGCTEESITQEVGLLPDDTGMSIIGGQLRSERDLSNMVTIRLYEGDKAQPEKISYAITQPAASAITLKTIADEKLVNAYNMENQTKFIALPDANVNFENSGTLTIPAGKQTSAPIDVSITTEGLKTDTTYLLALTVAEAVANVEAQSAKQKLYYSVYIQKKETTCQPNGPGSEEMEIPDLLSNVTSVFYVNTKTYQPLIVAAWGIGDLNDATFYSSIGNIVNLRAATIDYDAVSGRTLFNLDNDLSYVLEHSDKYIRPLQDKGRKVCICIENGGKGVGFCNMTDSQIAGFVQQVKTVMTQYNFVDGINLWDDDSKYGKAGMPETNTTSYPKLIKALREALPGKLLTLVDKGDATEYFYNVAKCGDIEVGRYIDYAWHGYCLPTENLQIINPNPGGSTQAYSKYTRRPIAGLETTRYGSVNIPLYPSGPAGEEYAKAPESISKWKSSGNKKSNIIVYGGDIIGPEYNYMGQYVEYSMITILSFFNNFMDDGMGWNFDTNDWSFGIRFYSDARLDFRLKGGVDANPYRKDW